MTSSCHANVQDLLLINPLEVSEVVLVITVARRRVLDITTVSSFNGEPTPLGASGSAAGVVLHRRAVLARVAGVEGTCCTAPIWPRQPE